jgi:hypothetical protein
MIVMYFAVGFVFTGTTCGEISHQGNGFKACLICITLFHSNIYRIFMIEVNFRYLGMKGYSCDVNKMR